ncbi:kelch domain-containing protein 3-like [Amblyomma americanum]
MWTARLSDVPDRVNRSAVSINGKVYSFDCHDADGTRTLRNLVYVLIFDPATSRWTTEHTQSLPDGRPNNIFLRAVAVYGHCAYLWGVPHGCLSQSVLYRFDTYTMAWSQPAVSGEGPTPRDGTSACVVGDRMYIFDDLHYSQDVRVLDLNTLEWHRIPTSGEGPARRFFHTASAIGTRMYVWGGSLAEPFHADHFQYMKSIFYLETTTSTWVCPQMRGVPPAGREGHSSFVYNGDLYIFGGYSPLLDTFYADIHKYDPEISCWTELKPSGSGPSARWSHSCTITGERVFVFGGVGPVAALMEEAIQEEVALTDFHVLHLAPTLENLCLLAVIDARLDTSAPDPCNVVAPSLVLHPMQPTLL